MRRASAHFPSLSGIARAVAIFCLGYWALFVLVAPVTNVDSHMYDLSRLLVAERGGLFGNPLFTTPYQVMWPWSFDSVHWVFLHLGFGYALPSYSCFLGLAFIAFRMTKARFGEEAAWATVVGLLSLTCLVYQATSTKNDIAVAFGGAVWLYARWRWLREKRPVHFFWMALAIGFMAGAKTTGVVYGFALGGWTLFLARGDRALWGRVIVSLIFCGVLFGSVETYTENGRRYGSLTGPADIVEPLKNTEGVRGTLANTIRFFCSAVYIGPTAIPRWEGDFTVTERAAHGILKWTGLNSAGVVPRERDRDLYFYETGFEEYSGFGPLGLFCVGIVAIALLYWQPKRLWWQLAIAVLMGVLSVSALAAYTAWSRRYLIGWFALAAVACVCALWSGEEAWRRGLRKSFLIVAILGALAAPLLSFNRGPRAIVASLSDRDHFETCVVPITGKVRDELKKLRVENPRAQIFFVAVPDSAVLPFLEDPALDIFVVSPEIFYSVLSRGMAHSGDIVAAEYDLNAPYLQPIKVVYAETPFVAGFAPRRTIYRLQFPAAP